MDSMHDRLHRAPTFPSGLRDKVTGRTTYAFDVVLPGMLHGKLLRSPHAHARSEASTRRRRPRYPASPSC